MSSGPYFAKLISYSDKHITSNYTRNLNNNHRLERERLLSCVESKGLVQCEVEYLFLACSFRAAACLMIGSSFD